MKVDGARREAYLKAYRDWQAQLEQLHRVFLESESLSPPQLKGLLNRESRAKERYDAARTELLGIPSGEELF